MSSQGSRDRTYSSPPSTHSLGFSYAWGPDYVQTGTVNDITGNWTPFQVDSNGNLKTTIAGGVTVSGGSAPNQVAITGSVGNVAVTGFSANIAPQAVSGFFTPIWTGSPNVTANVNVVDTGNRSVSVVNPLLATSGFFTPIWTGAPNVTAAVTIGNVAVTGGNISVTDPLSWALLSGISGSLASNLSAAAWVTGQIQLTGNVPVSVINPLLATSGNSTIINTAPIPFSGVTDVRSSSTAGNSTPSGNYPYTGMSPFAFGQALAANANRAELFIQNIHTGIPLYVNFGAVAASTGAFSMILNPSTQFGWGGTSFGTRSWRGAVQVSGGAWIAWEI